MQARSVKAIIFDMDGVLVDAKEWHYEALNLALQPFGLEISRDEHTIVYDGLPTKKKLKLLTEKKGLPTGLHDFVSQQKQNFTTRIMHSRCFPNFRHQYALRRLKREGYKMALASNSIRHTVDTMMDLCGLTDYLEFSLSNEDVSNPKPHPEIYLTAFNKLGFAPHECLVLEDNKNGIRSAKSAGAHIYEISTVDDVDYWRIVEKLSYLETTYD